MQIFVEKGCTFKNVQERRQALVDERTRKIEEKAAKELAAEERRKLAEAVNFYIFSLWLQVLLYQKCEYFSLKVRERRNSVWDKSTRSQNR